MDRDFLFDTSNFDTLVVPKIVGRRKLKSYPPVLKLSPEKLIMEPRVLLLEISSGYEREAAGRRDFAHLEGRGKDV